MASQDALRLTLSRGLPCAATVTSLGSVSLSIKEAAGVTTPELGPGQF